MSSLDHSSKALFQANQSRSFAGVVFFLARVGAREGEGGFKAPVNR